MVDYNTSNTQQQECQHGITILILSSLFLITMCGFQMSDRNTMAYNSVELFGDKCSEENARSLCQGFY